MRSFDARIKGELLKDVGSSHENNLGLFRYVAACGVVVCHSFPIALGIGTLDPLGALNDGRLSIGGLAVAIFLLMGGYLIAGSALRRRSFSSFFSARCSRIFPELLFVVAACVFVLGPIFTTLDLASYFSSSMTWKFFLNILLIPTHSLPGVFEGNPYPSVVNGSLWILSIEFLCYVLCFVCMRLGFLEKRRFPWLLLLSFVAYGLLCVMTHEDVFLMGVARPMVLFVVGMGFRVYNDLIHLNGRLAGTFALAFVVALGMGLTEVSTILLFPYVFFFLAFATKKVILKGRDYSYPMFLWGFPVQQAIVCIFSGVSWYVVAGVACIGAFLLGVATSICTSLISRKVSSVIKRH